MEGHWGERVVQKIQKQWLLQQAHPSLFAAFALFSLSSPPSLFAPDTSLPNYLTPTSKYNPTS